VAQSSNPRTCGRAGAPGHAGERSGKTEPVFDIKVGDGLHEFFANGALVHNTEWVPSESRNSPDRVDALVFAVTELQKRRQKAGMANPANLRSVN
jgi:hypothetical protein